MFSKSEKLLLFILAAVHFTHIVDFMIMMPLGPQLMRIFGIDPHQFGLLVSSYTFSAGLSGFISSFFIDKFDRKNSLLFFYVGFAVGTVACAISRDYTLLLISRSFTGAFGGVISSVVLSIVSDSFSVERRGTAIGIVMGAFAIASVLGVPFSLLLANHYDWHAPFMFLGVFAFFISIFVALKLTPMKDHLKGKHLEKGDLFYAIKHILNTPNQVKALIFIFFVVVGQFSIIPFISPSFVSNGKLPESQLPILYLLGGIVSMISSPMMGRLSDLYGKKKVFYLGAASSIVPVYFITNLYPSNAFWMFFVSSVFFLVMSGRMVPAMAIMSTAATPRYRGSFMSITSSVQQLSAALASYISGLVVFNNADGRLMNYNFVGYGSMAFSVLAIWMVMHVHPVEGTDL